MKREILNECRLSFPSLSVNVPQAIMIRSTSAPMQGSTKASTTRTTKNMVPIMAAGKPKTSV